MSSWTIAVVRGFASDCNVPARAALHPVIQLHLLRKPELISPVVTPVLLNANRPIVVVAPCIGWVHAKIEIIVAFRLGFTVGLSTFIVGEIEIKIFKQAVINRLKQLADRGRTPVGVHYSLLLSCIGINNRLSVFVINKRSRKL